MPLSRRLDDLQTCMTRISTDEDPPISRCYADRRGLPLCAGSPKRLPYRLPFLNT